MPFISVEEHKEAYQELELRLVSPETQMAEPVLAKIYKTVIVTGFAETIKKRPTLSLMQRQALHLHLVDAYYHGSWVETLEFSPCKARLAGKPFTPKTFGIEHEKLAQQSLNENWGVLNSKQYHNIAKRLFEGMHSQIFAYDIQSENANSMVEQLSGLTKLSEESI